MRERQWVPADLEGYVQSISSSAASASGDDVLARIDELTEQNRATYAEECVQLNPAANLMNPRAEAALSAGLGSRPSLGYPGDKYEMGLEAVEQIEVIAAQLACEVFEADFAEVRVGSGALANLYTFMACCQPGDAIIVPPGSIGGHVTHNRAGAAGLYGLDIYEAPIDADNYTFDIDGLATMTHAVRPKMITVGSSLNLTHHPVADIRAIADEVGAKVLFDAAHLSGVIAGKAWPNPLCEGAHVMTCSTYKSLGGPPSGLLVTSDMGIAERVDAIAFPGLTANFDVGKVAALAIALVDTQRHGQAYAREMVSAAAALQQALARHGIDALSSASHAFALRTDDGHQLAKHLRAANLLASGIGLPGAEGDAMNGLRLGTNEIVRSGLATNNMDELAALIAAAIQTETPADLANEVSAFRQRFTGVHFAN
ncbi:MAG: glycine hydroxymethyltransferase [Ilumatobacter sp.]|jgi:glycine hydroxymethyltransferase